MLYQVLDNFLGKEQPMLCNMVTFTLDLSGGQLTSLSLVDPKSYTLELAKPTGDEAPAIA